MIKVDINIEEDIVKARQEARKFAKNMGFGIIDQTRITTAVSELARNIYTYAKKGEVYIEKIDKNNDSGIKITFKDEGPGIEDIELALQDGYSTSNSLGKGLPGAKRLVDVLEAHSEPEKGTTIVIIRWLE